MNNNELLTEFFDKKNYDNLKIHLQNASTTKEKEILARVYLEEKDYHKASILYREMGMLYEHGRCELLLGNLDTTKKIWDSIKVENSALLWGRSLLEFINLYVIHIPTFFQIRAFLEVDLDALLKANLITYCENIVNGAHLLAQNNQESYKFIGRVFVNNEQFDLADLFLQKAKDICYIDPEVHFLLAKCYLHNREKSKAIKSLETSVEKGFGYYPAKKMLNEIVNGM